MFGVKVKSTSVRPVEGVEAGPTKRTQQPMVTGTSVLGVKVSVHRRKRGTCLACVGERER